MPHDTGWSTSWITLTGQELMGNLAASQLLQNPDAVFSSQLMIDDEQELKVAAHSARSILADVPASERLVAALLRGDWAGAVQIAEMIGKESAVPAAKILSYSIGLLYVPACSADIFSVAAVSGGKPNRKHMKQCAARRLAAQS
jgi:hypothetical protein